MRNANPALAFSGEERADLAKALLLTSLAFAIFFLRTGFVGDSVSFTWFALIFLISAATAGTGFIVHELCHKVAAHRFRVHGEFRANTQMLLLTVVLALFGVIFAAPGAVHLFGNVTRKESGIISAAGPVSNMALALLFAPFALLGSGIVATACSIGAYINALLGAFNLIPFLGLDGEKILAWHAGIYAFLAVVAGLLAVGAHVLL
jgi:Zn-dependent protease